MKTPSRQRRYQMRMAEDGYVQVSIWVPGGTAQWVHAVAAALRVAKESGEAQPLPLSPHIINPARGGQHS